VCVEGDSEAASTDPKLISWNPARTQNRNSSETLSEVLNFDRKTMCF
jgi:hypothetical protein